MNRFIFCTLFGLLIANSVFAASADSRQNFCEQYPDKYVWVEKTQACIPINPCKSDNEDIKNAYCVRVGFPATAGAFEIYIKNVLKTDVKEHKYIDDYTSAYTTTDGDYKYFIADKYSYLGTPDSTQNAIAVACWAYGAEETRYSLKSGEEMDPAKLVCFSDIKQISKTNCSDIASYAASLNETDCKGNFVVLYSSENYCEVKCDAAR